MSRKKWTQDEIDYIRENWGISSCKEISKYLGRSQSSIQHKVEREGIKNPQKWTEEEIHYLIENYNTKTNKELAEALNRTKTAVDLKINRLGLVKSKYHYNHDFFENIDAEEKAYWCGFIMADGFVAINKELNSCELGIQLQAKDHNHLRKFNKVLGGNVPITFKSDICNLNNKPRHSCRIRFYSEKLVHDLEKYGIIPNKSLVKLFPENIPDYLMKHYIRGYFDGNGTIVSQKSGNKFYTRIMIRTGSLKFIEGMKNYLNQQDIKTGTIYKDTRSECYTLRIDSIEHTQRFIHYIYQDSSIYLDRKYKKMLECTNKVA